jgi:tetratricopeptide (TPR) repeat protein
MPSCPITFRLTAPRGFGTLPRAGRDEANAHKVAAAGKVRTMSHHDLSEPKLPTRRVFISSTSLDLRAHRERVRDTLLSLGLFPVGMEQFGAQGAGDATSISTDKVASCDLYLGIIAWRYGYVPAGAQRSVTHEEYVEAARLSMPRFIFLADPSTDTLAGPDDLFPTALRDAEHRAQLDGFRAELGRSHVVDFFTTPADLAARVATALTGYLLSVRERELTRGVRPPHDLPPGAHAFVGREELLATVTATLRGEGGAHMSVALAGMAGVGKSALAAEALHRLEATPDDFPGGVAWVRCDGRTGVPGLVWVADQLLGAWGITLAPDELARVTSPEADLDLRERALRTRLRPRDGTAPPPALVLLDNVERELPLGRALDLLAPLGITALLTARHEPSSPRLRLVTLDVLDPEAAAQLFAQRYADRGGAWDAARDEGAAATVVQALGRLPLAVELAAARAARARTGVAVLAAELGEADRLGRLRDPLDPTRSVRYAFEQSLGLLSPLRRARFAALGLPDGPDWPRPIVEGMLDALPGADAASPGGDDLDLLAALSLVSLVMPDATASVARVRIHPLLRDLAREELARQPEPVRAAALDALLRGVHDLVERSRTDYFALGREEELIAGTVRRAAEAGEAPALVGSTVAALDGYVDVAGHWRLGEEWATLRLAACRAMGDQAGEASARNDQGFLAYRLGRLEAARAHYLAALDLRRAAGDHGGEAETLNNLGTLLTVLGQPQAAATNYEQALAIRRELRDGAGEGVTLNNLGLLAAAIGHPAEAERYYQQAVAKQRAAGDRRREGTSLANLGAVAATLGQTDQALGYFEQALALQRTLSDRAGEATTLNNLGGLTDHLGRRDEAGAYYEQALALRRELGDRIGEGTTLNNLGGLASNLGRPDQAKRYYEQALAVAREVNNRGAEGTSLANLGLLARAQLRQQEARRHFEQALPLQREAGDRTGEATTLHHLGLLAFADGRDGEARSQLTQALAILAETGPAEAAQVVRQNLAELGTASDAAPAASPNAASDARVPATQPVPADPASRPMPPPTGAAAKLARRWWPFGR